MQTLRAVQKPVEYMGGKYMYMYNIWQFFKFNGWECKILLIFDYFHDLKFFGKVSVTY